MQSETSLLYSTLEVTEDDLSLPDEENLILIRKKRKKNKNKKKLKNV